MAENFTRKTERGIGVAATAIEGYVAPADTQVTVIGLSVANITGATVKATITLFDGTNSTHIVKSMDVIPGQAQVVVGGDQKLVLKTGDSVRVQSDTAASLDSIMSVLELS